MKSITEPKLIITLKTLSRAEMRAFQSFCSDSMWNKNKKLITLSAYLLQQHPRFPEDKINRISVFGMLFPERSYDDQQMRDAFSQLRKLLNSFLSICNMRRDGFLNQYLLLRELNFRDLSAGFRQAVNKAEASGKKENSGIDRYRNLLALENEKMIFNEKRFIDTHTLNIKYGYKNMLDALNIHYLLELYSVGTAIRLEEQTTRRTDHIPMKKLLRISSLIRELVPGDNLLVGLNRLLYDFNDQPNVSTYKSLFESVIQRGDQLPDYEFTASIKALTAFCLKELRTGAEEYNHDLHFLYMKLLERGSHIENGVMSSALFKSMFFCSVLIGKFAHANKLIRDYGGLMIESARAGTIALCKAYAYFHKKMFKESLRELGLVTFENDFRKLDHKNMLLLIYFERKDHEAFYSQVNSYKQMLRKGVNVPLDLQKACTNLVKFSALLYRIQTGVTSDTPEMLEKKVMGLKDIVYKSWLLNKIKELRPR